MEIGTVVLHGQDNVAVLTRGAGEGDVLLIPEGRIAAREAIPTGHKAAICPIGSGDAIYKYGTMIGRAKCAIAPGEWVHVHNVEDVTEQICNEYAAQYRIKAREAERHG